MRDPLSHVRIRYKLPLGFLVICLVAFGIGGVVLTASARAALTEQIERRLDERAGALRVVVERHLALHERRAEDFASDGHIRAQLAALDAARRAGQLEKARRTREELERHLAQNKLPLVAAFEGALVYAKDGSPVARVPSGASPDPEHARVVETTLGPLGGATDAQPFPTFRISTPLASLDGTRRIGVLQLVLRADRWVQGMDEVEALPDLEHGAMRLRAGGIALRIPEGRVETGAAAMGKAEIRYERAMARTGWSLGLAVDRESAMAPADDLRNQYLLIGLALLLVIAGILYFPVRFLLRPLSSISEAARRFGRGDFKARVEHESSDEIGDLAHAFNLMADAIEDRTRRLEEAADTLRRREQDLRLERNRLATVIRGMEDGLFILDSEGEVTLSNAAAQPIVDALAEQDETARRLECAHEGRPDIRCLSCLADIQGGQQECVVERDGRIYEIHVTTLPAAPGKRPGRLCVSRDVTQRLNAQETQAHQERMTVLGEIAAVMAHELNNPLAAISMFSQMLAKRTGTDRDVGERAQVILRNAEACKRTISGLLDLAARGALETAPMDVAALLEDVVRFLAPLYERAGVALDLATEGADPMVVGDEVQLRQVFINLLMNALQACEPGGQVRVALEDAEEELAITVEDDGAGIPEDVRDRIFEPFFTTKGPGVGTGLGLPTSRRIVAEHGGALTLAESGPERTVFSLRLPRKADRRAWRQEARLKASVAGDGEAEERS